MEASTQEIGDLENAVLRRIGPLEARKPLRGRIVGSLKCKLPPGKSIVIGPASVYSIEGQVTRRSLLREPTMIDDPENYPRVIADTVATYLRRKFTGESPILYQFTGGEKGGAVGISSNEIGGALVAVPVLSSVPLIARQQTFFASYPELSMRVASPLTNIALRSSMREVAVIVREALFGPGAVFQKFIAPESGDSKVILQIDGSFKYAELKEGEKTPQLDPRHLYAWDESVSTKLVPYGTPLERLCTGEISNYVELKGPGRVWYSPIGFGDGYLGTTFSPAHWVYQARQTVSNLMSKINPF